MGVGAGGALVDGVLMGDVSACQAQVWTACACVVRAWEARWGARISRYCWCGVIPGGGRGVGMEGARVWAAHSARMAQV